MNRSQTILAAALLGTFLAGCEGTSEVLNKPSEPTQPTTPVTPTDPVAPVTPVDPEKPQPANLEVSATASPGRVAIGQEISLDVTITNLGPGQAQEVAPVTPLLMGNAAVMLKEAPALSSVSLNGGASQRFRYLYVATDDGSLIFEVGARGMDAIGERLAPAVRASVVVEGPVQLAVNAITAPATTAVGQTFSVVVQAANVGQTEAQQVAPTALAQSGGGTATLVTGPTPAPQTLAPGATANFTLTYKATTAGRLTLSGAASARDPRTGAAVSSEQVSSMPIVIEVPAALTGTLSIPSMLSSGQTFTATLLVKNTGTAAAQDVLPGAPVQSGTASATVSVSPGATLIPGGATAAFNWTYVANGTGTLTLAVGAAGVDAATGAAVTAPVATSGPAMVTAPSMLSVTSLSLPAAISRGQPFTATLVVRNNGGTTINGVQPNPSPPTLTGTTGASATTATAPAAQTLAPGASATFTWSYVENGTGAGTLALTAGARGTDAVSGAVVTANPTQSNLAVVRQPPALLVESVTLPARVSRGQPFTAQVTVRNTGGANATAVRPVLTLTKGGAASASTATVPTPAELAGGATATFSYNFVEDGTGAGTLQLAASAAGTDPLTSAALSAPQVSSGALTVQTAAALTVTAFTLPANVIRGATFAVSLTVSNGGQAAATGVIPNPNPPGVTITGGAAAVTATALSPVTIAGGASQTFTWTYTENGTANGTLAFRASVKFADANSARALETAIATSNATSVGALLGCNGSQLYSGIGDLSLDADRVDKAVGLDRLRVKSYDVLSADFVRVLGALPTSLQNQGPTFGAAPARFSAEPLASAVSLYTTFAGAFQGCLTYTGSAAAYSANPTAATANTECTNFIRKFWSRIPTAAELSPCVGFATGTPIAAETNPRRRWAYTCAAVLTAPGFIAE